LAGFLAGRYYGRVLALVPATYSSEQITLGVIMSAIHSYDFIAAASLYRVGGLEAQGVTKWLRLVTDAVMQCSIV
jgi:hypothetical protein